MKLHENRQLFADAVRVTSETMGIAPEFVEKDYWICQILQNLSRHQDSGSMVWKGGTSLSKASIPCGRRLHRNTRLRLVHFRMAKCQTRKKLQHQQKNCWNWLLK